MQRVQRVPLWQLGYAVGGHWGDTEDCNAQLCFLNRSGDVLYRNTRVKGSWCAALPTSGSLGELLADSAAALCPRLGLLAAAGPAGTTTARMPCGTGRRHGTAVCSSVVHTAVCCLCVWCDAGMKVVLLRHGETHRCDKKPNRCDTCYFFSLLQFSFYRALKE